MTNLEFKKVNVCMYAKGKLKYILPNDWLLYQNSTLHLLRSLQAITYD